MGLGQILSLVPSQALTRYELAEAACRYLTLLSGFVLVACQQAAIGLIYDLACSPVIRTFVAAGQTAELAAAEGECPLLGLAWLHDTVEEAMLRAAHAASEGVQVVLQGVQALLLADNESRARFASVVPVVASARDQLPHHMLYIKCKAAQLAVAQAQALTACGRLAELPVAVNEGHLHAESCAGSLPPKG